MNSKPNKSGVIRKGTMPLEEITKLAQELQPEVVEVVEAPEIKTEGDYGVYASLIKAHCAVHETYEATVQELRNVFPQTKKIANIARNLKRSHGLSYRRVENGDNDIYVFFVEPTREELIVQLTSAESKVLELEEQAKNQNEVIKDLMKANTNRSNTYKKDTKSQRECIESMNDDIYDLKEENTKLKSELYNEKSMTIVSFVFAIICLIITISSGTISSLLTQIFGSLTQLQ